MDVPALPLTVIQVATDLQLLCAVCERRMPFVVYFHHLSEAHPATDDGENVRKIMEWIDGQKNAQATLLLSMLQAVYIRWKMEQDGFGQTMEQL